MSVDILALDIDLLAIEANHIKLQLAMLQAGLLLSSKPVQRRKPRRVRPLSGVKKEVAV